MTATAQERVVRELKIGSPAEAPTALAGLGPAEARSEAVRSAVAAAVSAVRDGGDAALLNQVRRFDWPCPGASSLRVPAAAMRDAWDALDGDLREALEEAAASVRAFHARQRPARCAPLLATGSGAGLCCFPLESAGLYVPGGKASYPSTLLMLAIPAQLAGVGRIAAASPAGPDGLPARAVLAAAFKLGVSEFYAVGGAAAVAAFAYGTATVPRVDKIFGPGNAYVAEAKRQVSGDVGIDAVAGPTELVVLSDGSSPAGFIASDLLAQAEHDEEAQAVLLTTCPSEVQRVLCDLSERIGSSPRAAVQRASLARRGALALCADRETACAAARFLAPEHLSVQTRDPEVWARAVPTAAAVFLGPFAPEAAGDYGAGPNHSLPTGGTARFSSPVCVWDFVRYQSWLSLDGAALGAVSPWMQTLARAEGLWGHAESLRVRGGAP